MESSFRFRGKKYLFYPKGVKYYKLYRTTRKINSFNELKYIAEKFIYLNPDFDVEIMTKLFLDLSDRSSGHIIRTYGEKRVEMMVYEVADQKKVPYCPRLRKIIFNPFKKIDIKTKMKIVGELINTKEKPKKEHLDGIIQELWSENIKITVLKVAEKARTTRYMVKWYFDNKKKNEISGLNKIIRETFLISKAIEAIDFLTEGGDIVKMRHLKKITSIRDYSILKKAVKKYEDAI
jgi:hypothetical protein